MSKIKGGVETITLCGSHAIILRNTPQVILDNPDKLGECYKDQESKQFGLFGPEINYNTFYPDATPDMFTPKDEDFIEPTYRLLSEVIVHKNWNPIDFSMNGVLKASMPLLLGQTINCDHEGGIGNAIGAVSKVFWQDSYNMKGIDVPAGINGVLKIDAKSNPKIARGIQMDPPSIHSNSVSVNFKWEQSHPSMDREEFWDKLGSYDKDGNMVRKVVSEIITYYHTSLVDHGADPFAQIIKDDKIINPVFAQANNLSKFSKKEIDEAKKSTNSVFLMSFKSVENLSHKTTGSKEYKNDNSDNNNSNENPKKMEELQEFLGKLPKAENGQPWTVETLSAVLTSVTTLAVEKTSLTSKITELEGEKTTLTAQLQAYKDAEAANLTSLKESAKATYKLAMGHTAEDHKDAITEVIDNGDTKVVEALQKQYQVLADKNMPITCKKCGSTDCSRASAEVNSGEDKSKTPISNSAALDAAKKKKTEE